MRRWNIDLLKEETDLRELVGDLGIPTERHGSTVFMKCLAEGHEHETRLDHCQCNREYCKCHSCGTSFDIFGVAMRWAELQNEDNSFERACERIAQSHGNPERFLLSGTEKVKTFPYSNEELECAGFKVDRQTKRFLQDLFDEDPVFVKSIILRKLDETIGTLEKICSLNLPPDRMEEAKRELRAAKRFSSRLTGKKTGSKMLPRKQGFRL